MHDNHALGTRDQDFDVVVQGKRPHDAVGASVYQGQAVAEMQGHLERQRYRHGCLAGLKVLQQLPLFRWPGDNNNRDDNSIRALPLADGAVSGH